MPSARKAVSLREKRNVVSFLSDFLGAERHRQFVGRERELGVLSEALEAERLPFHILYVHGPGGVGKTTLMREFQHRSEEAGARVLYLDARDIEPTPAAFMEALRHAAERNGEAAGEQKEPFLSSSERQVLLVDTFEALAQMDRWIRERFLPRLPAETLLVLSGRQARSPGWKADPGLKALVRALPVRNLSRSESGRYLQERQVPKEQHEDILAFAHGHPLALSLIADAFDQQPELDFQPEETPDLVGALLKRFMDEVPSPLHRRAIQVAAMVRHASETLLAEALDEPDVHDLFEWLRSLSFIEAGRYGLFPHDLAREVIVADFRWRNREQHQDLHQQLRRYYSQKLRAGQTNRHEHVLADYLFLHRDNPVVKPFFVQLQSQWSESASPMRDRLRDEDHEALQAMVAEHEGETSAEMAAYWFKRQPQATQVFRDGDGKPAGFLCALALHETDESDAERDPAVAAARQYLEAHAPLRKEEKATLFRFWMDREVYQSVSPIQGLIFVETIRHYLQTPRLAFTLLPCRQPDFWALVFAYADLQRLPEASFETDGHAFGVFGHDWRAVPPAAWLDLVAKREITLRSPEKVEAPPAATLLVLSKPDFADAVKDALRDFVRPEALRKNPLLRSRLIMEDVGPDANPDVGVEALKALLLEAAQALEAAPRQAKYYSALHATYLDPEPTQERAAEHLDLPFSTYRRHLRKGIDSVAEALWRREVGG